MSGRSNICKMMKHIYPFLFFVFLFEPGFSQVNSNEKAIINSKAVADDLKKLPVTFRKNMGQWDDNIVYQGFSPGWNANINFMKNGLSFGLKREAKNKK